MTLADLRQRIDELDMEIIQLLNERAVVSLKIGEKKQEQNLSIYNSAREEEVIGKVKKKNTGPLTDENIESIFTIIINSCRTLQEKEI